VVRQWPPRWACATVAVLVFFGGCCVAFVGCDAVASEIWTGDWGKHLSLLSRASENVVFGSLLLVILLGSYLLARFVFFLLRWRQVYPEEPRCRKCGYDLTGNVSGTCPECGTRAGHDRKAG
jgi:hypothetical protein